MDEAFSALDVLTGERLREDILELWQGGSMPTKAILVVSHNIEEAVLMADRVLVFASDPGRVRSELKIDLPRPRDPNSATVRALIDEVYALMTASRDGLPAAKPAASPLAVRLPEADVISMEGVLEMLADAPFDGRADLPQLVEESELTDEDLLPIAKALHMLGFAVVEHGDVQLTSLGQHYVNGQNALRHELFGQQLLAHVPLAAHIRHSLEQEESGELSEKPFLKLLCESMSMEEAERVLEVTIEWGRYGEVFEYNYHTGTIHLPEGDEAPSPT